MRKLCPFVEVSRFTDVCLYYRFHCIVTQPLNYFAVWLKSLNRFSVYQINLFPTAAQALALVTTLSYGWISDALGGKRWQLMTIPAVSVLSRQSCKKRALHKTDKEALDTELHRYGDSSRWTKLWGHILWIYD